jgi:YHS domain-containing protein
MNGLNRVIVIAATLAAGVTAQEPLGAPLLLVSPGSLPQRQAGRTSPPAGPAERTYQRRKVDPVSHDRDGIAIQGYDAVAYLNGNPGKGRKEYSAEYAGALWLFATPENRDAFRRAPDLYAPQYGGFCAFSLSIGSPAHADPRVFIVVDRKLYLFFDTAVRLVWEQDRGRTIMEANMRWPGLHR